MAASTLTRYPKEVLRLLGEVTFGRGGLAVIGGTVGVIMAMTFFTGTEVGLQGYTALNQLGTGAFAGFFSAYFNTREIAPVVTGIALAATVGCGFTAQLGAMRISEEVDAVEVMAIRSLPYLVCTRVLAGMVAIIPLYAVGLLSSYVGTRLTVTLAYGQSTGTYDHYFNLFLPPGDIAWSFVKVIIFAVAVIMIHCYYGYTASGGPVGVGIAVGARCALDRRDQRRRPVALDGDLGHDHHRQAGRLMAHVPLGDRPGVVRASGIAALVLVLALVWLTYAVFTKKFTHDLPATVTSDGVGLELSRNADVKLRGVIVGRVAAITSDGTDAEIHLALDPDLAGTIPARVEAYLVPKTLFGEKYVDLRPLAGAGGTAITAGARIAQGSLPPEVEQVLNDATRCSPRSSPRSSPTS